jgi:excisionase family DNA binding protein
MADDVMTTAQAAAYLPISLATRERWTRAGVVPVVTRPGRRRVLFLKAALDQRLRGHQRGRGDEPKMCGVREAGAAGGVRLLPPVWAAAHGGQ